MDTPLRARYSADAQCEKCGKKPVKAHGLCQNCYQNGRNAELGYGRNWVLLDKYGISLEDLRTRLAAQNYACAICGIPIDESCHVDHRHACCPGKRTCGQCLRGLLCGRCNRGLGMFDDSRGYLSRAIEYLKKWET